MGYCMYDNIREGKYDNKLPYVPKKKDPEAYMAYNQEASRLIDLFAEDLEKEFNTSKLKGKDKIFSYAWEQGHAYGFNEVLNHYADVAKLVVDVMLANLPEK